MEPSPPLRDDPLAFQHLPLELKLEVFEILYASHNTRVTPILGQSAAWTNPFCDPPQDEEENPQPIRPTTYASISSLKAMRL